MKVFTLLSDRGGSGFYRMAEPARVAAARGIDISFGDSLDVEARKFADGSHEVYEITQDVDVLMMQRPLPQIHYAVAVAAKRQGIAVVMDLDDDFHNVHHKNVAITATNWRASPMENLRWLMKSLALADVITVSTPALLKYDRDGMRGIVVRNRVPEAILTLPRRMPTGRVGWTGNVETHPEDLQAARGVLDQIPTDIAIVGYEMGVAEALQIPAERVHLGSRWVPSVPGYWRALNGSMDVGLVPLETSDFNRAKSALKGIEYLSLGKPFIASPLPEYRRLVEESGGGVLAVGPRKWAEAARMLLEDGDQYRKSGLEWAHENTLEKNIDEWILVWELALERCKR